MRETTERTAFDLRVFVPEEPCWIWHGYIGHKGYGSFIHRGTRRFAHRAAYEIYVGPIPDGYEVHHKCFNRACVNPRHLEATTHIDNVAASTAVRTHCMNGHPFDEANTIYVNNGTVRACLTCRREAGKRNAAKKRRADGRRELSKTHCPKGHEYTDANTYYEMVNGYRTRKCVECRRIRQRKPGGYLEAGRLRRSDSDCCPHGHAFTPENTYTAPNGRYRYCRICNREAARRKKK